MVVWWVDCWAARMAEYWVGRKVELKAEQKVVYWAGYLALMWVVERVEWLVGMLAAQKVVH
jgi:hypothetical protein